MLCAVDGDDELHLLMRTAMVQTCIIRGELWIATQVPVAQVKSEVAGAREKSHQSLACSDMLETVVGVAAWLPPTAENHPRYTWLP